MCKEEEWEKEEEEEEETCLKMLSWNSGGLSRIACTAPALTELSRFPTVARTNPKQKLPLYFSMLSNEMTALFSTQVKLSIPPKKLT